jgi:hypothetical protein
MSTDWMNIEHCPSILALLGNPVYMEDLMGNSSVNRGFSNKLNHV